MDKPENPQAFPRTGEGFGNPHYDTPGMTLLDYFAGQALAAISVHIMEAVTGAKKPANECPKLIAGLSYSIAHAMLVKRAGKSDAGGEGA